MGRIKFYGIFTCIFLVHAESPANNNGYTKYTESTVTPRYEGDNYQTRMNMYNTENKGKDYSFPNKDGQLNNIENSLPFTGYSINGQSARAPEYTRTSQEPFNSNSYYMNDHTYSNFGKYLDKSGTKEPDLKHHKQFNLPSYSNDNHHDSISYNDYTSGIHSENIFASPVMDEYGSDSDIGTEGKFTGEDYIGNAYLLEKQNGNNVLNYKGFYHDNNVLNSLPFDMRYTEDNYKMAHGNNQDHLIEDSQNSALTNYFSNIRGRGFRFHNQEKYSNGYYPSKNDFNYLPKGYKVNYVPLKYREGNTKTIFIRKNRSNVYPRQIHSNRLYVSAVPLNFNRNYKKRSHSFINRPIYVRGDSSTVKYNNRFVNINDENNSGYISNADGDPFTTDF